MVREGVGELEDICVKSGHLLGGIEGCCEEIRDGAIDPQQDAGGQEGVCTEAGGAGLVGDGVQRSRGEEGGG